MGGLESTKRPIWAVLLTWKWIRRQNFLAQQDTRDYLQIEKVIVSPIYGAQLQIKSAEIGGKMKMLSHSLLFLAVCWFLLLSNCADSYALWNGLDYGDYSPYSNPYSAYGMNGGYMSQSAYPTQCSQSGGICVAANNPRCPSRMLDYSTSCSTGSVNGYSNYGYGYGYGYGNGIYGQQAGGYPNGYWMM